MEGLLERDEELAILVESLERAGGGRGAFVLVGGEAGIGKTSLLRALRARVGDRVAFLAGACEPLSVPVPLAPVRELAESAGVAELAGLEGADRIAFAGALLRALHDRGPAVAVIEDAHWADPATLDVIRALARRIVDAGVVLVVTYRDDELGANRALSLLVGDLATDAQVRRIVMRPLTGAAVRALAEPAGVDAEELVRVTGGNPFLVVEAIAAGRQIPSSVRDATLARVGRLGPGARGVVDAAAVIGQRFSPAMLAAVAPESLDAVDEALAHGVLTDDGEMLGFRHELTRRAIESSVATPRRAALHARVVAALLRLAPDEHARLAHHAEEAQLVDEACRFATLAAADAERVGALREASLQLERALRLGAALGVRERFDLSLRYARAANFSSRMDAALDGAHQALALAEAAADPRLRGRALTVLAWALWSLDRLPEAAAAAQEAVELLEESDELAELARAHASRMRMHATAFDPQAAIDGAPRALELAEHAGLEEVRVDVLISLGLARGHRGDDAACDLLAEGLAGAVAAGLHIQTIRAYVNTVAVAASARRHADVDAVSERAFALFDAYQTPIPRDAVTVYVARSLLDRGRWDDALAAVARSARTWHGELPLARALEGLVRARRGEVGAQTILDEAWSALEGAPPGPRHAVVAAALAEAAWLRGDPQAAIGQGHAVRGWPSGWQFARSAGELALWAFRSGQPLAPPAGTPEPIVRELQGDWRAAIRGWRELDAPYEAALAALVADERAAREALATLRRLGASGAARAFARERHSSGARVPRGPRRSTLAHPAGLTRREQEVLDRLATGATNAQIAAGLHLSERTVAHHVSAVLTKLGAPTRMAAVMHARQTGLLAEDGPATLAE